MRKVRDYIRRDYPHIYALACAFHFVDLMAKKLINDEDCKKSIDSTRTFVRWWKGHSVPNAIYLSVTKKRRSALFEHDVVLGVA